MKSKNILIPWTGGFDSTALVLKALTEGYSIYPAYINLINNKKGIKKEEKARNSIYKYLNKNLKMWEGNSPHECANIEDFLYIGVFSGYFFPKIIIYACLDLTRNDIDEIWIGYTKSDKYEEGFDLNHHMKLIPETLISMIKLTYPSLKKMPKILFPFSNTYKTEMLKKYYNNDKFRPIFEMLATCPFGKSYKTGCDCDKCIKLKKLSDILHNKIEKGLPFKNF